MHRRRRRLAGWWHIEGVGLAREGWSEARRSAQCRFYPLANKNTQPPPPPTLPCRCHCHLCVQAPPTPPVDPDNEEFVIFVRSKKVRNLYSNSSCSRVLALGRLSPFYQQARWPPAAAALLERALRAHAQRLACTNTDAHIAHAHTRTRTQCCAAAQVGAPEHHQGRHRSQPAGQGPGQRTEQRDGR